MKILFLSDDAGIKEVSLSKRRLVSLAVISLFLLAGISWFTIDVLTGQMYKVKIQNMKQDNTRLIAQMERLRSRLDTLEVNLARLQQQDNALRSYADLPQEDADIRQLGIGGTRYDKTIKLDYLLPSKDAKISDLRMDVDQLEMKLNLERRSYEKLYETVKSNRAKIEATPSIRPVDTGYITDGFGYRPDPFTRKIRFHYGLDISTTRGTPIYATADGTVKYAKRRGGFGLVVALEHEYGYETLYGHMLKFSVKAGDQVKRGQKIGEVGNTGRSTASHLHYEVRVDGEPVNPVDYFFSGHLASQ